MCEHTFDCLIPPTQRRESAEPDSEGSFEKIHPVKHPSLDCERDEESSELEPEDDGERCEDGKTHEDIWTGPPPCHSLLREEDEGKSDLDCLPDSVA